MKRDAQIFELIQNERVRQTDGIELIASENYVSDQVMEAMGSVLTNKYAEGLPGKRYYGGCEVVDQIEDLARERLKTLFNACWCNVQPHSGAQANAAVMLACLKPGDTIMGFNLSHGGHLTHGSAVNYSGKLYRPVFYGVNRLTGMVDYDEMAETARKEQPGLIIAGASAYARDWDYKRMRAIADEVGALLMADISHPAGLIARGLLNDPMPYCHIITSTTHKTLRGPRGGVIMMGENFENPWGITFKSGKVRKMAGLIDSAVFPGIQGGPLEHIIAAKAVAFAEALNDGYLDYCKKIMANAAAMARAFLDLGYDAVSGGTDNHCILLDLRNKGITGKEAEDALIKADITVNKNMVPFDDRPPTVTSGVRIGTPAITTRGMAEQDMALIVEYIDAVLTNKDDDKMINDVRAKVNKLMHDRPLYCC